MSDRFFILDFRRRQKVRSFRATLPVVILSVFLLPASAHMLEVRFNDDPLISIPKISGSVKNVSGTSILGDIRIVGIAFERSRVFLGHTESLISGSISPNSSKPFNLHLDVNGAEVHNIYLQFEANNSVLSYEVVGGLGSNPWPPESKFLYHQSPLNESTLASRRSQESAAPSTDCELLIVGMVIDQSKGWLRINGRVRNVGLNDYLATRRGTISGRTINDNTVTLRVTLYDAIGAYVQEFSEPVVGVGEELPRGAERAFSYRGSFPTIAKKNEVSFITESGLKISHCVQ